MVSPKIRATLPPSKGDENDVKNDREIQLPYMPLYVVDFMGSTRVQMLDNEQIGIYFRLLCHIWTLPGCRLIRDKTKIKRLLNVDRWSRKLDFIDEFFDTDKDGYLYNPKQQKVWREFQEKHRKQREKAAAAARARHSNIASGPMLQACATSNPTSNPTSTAPRPTNSELRTHKESTTVDSSRAHARDGEIDLEQNLHFLAANIVHPDDIHRFPDRGLIIFAASLEANNGNFADKLAVWNATFKKIAARNRVADFREKCVEIAQARIPALAEPRGLTRAENEAAALMGHAKKILRGEV